ncbi:hypothetical protein [Plantactinospora sp. GCM10030261]|uniref:hypothetical protein n=1 Tax=Plantactinospora sp. GCM10030261 TaxID=3273420 RepID=UPI0036197233
MRVMPLVFVTDVDTAADFFRLLDLDLDVRGRAGGWAELVGSGGLVGLHTATATDSPARPGSCALGFVTDGPLEPIWDRLVAHGYADAHIIDEGFGRSLRVTGPDAMEIQINEHDQELYA